MMTGKVSDPGTMPKNIMKSEGDVGEGEEIWASFGEGSWQVLKKVGSGPGIRVSTGKVESR